MLNISRLKNRTLSKLISGMPFLSKFFIDSYSPRESHDIPWTPVSKPLSESKIALVTTSGVHHKDQEPFNMLDTNGDPSFRVIDTGKPVSSLKITHDYYDHSNAERDINIVLPVERLMELKDDGLIGEIADHHYAFMGHIDGHHIDRLMNETAPAVAQLLKADRVDAVMLIPA